MGARALAAGAARPIRCTGALPRTGPPGATAAARARRAPPQQRPLLLAHPKVPRRAVPGARTGPALLSDTWGADGRRPAPHNYSRGRCHSATTAASRGQGSGWRRSPHLDVRLGPVTPHRPKHGCNSSRERAKGATGPQSPGYRTISARAADSPHDSLRARCYR